MREILFKAKRVDNGEWIEGYLFDNGMSSEKRMFIGKLVIVPYKGTACDKWSIEGIDFDEVDPDTICQFTGLCDKNGKEIWENDIIKYHFGEIYAPIKYGCYQNCFDSQKTEHVGFYVDWADVKCLRKDLGYWINMVDTMPVGNIFDNPELLQKVRWKR